jgi:hypothetical protein
MRLSAVLKALLTTILSAGLVGAQEKPSPRLTQAQAVKDAKAFVELLELSHPDPYINMGGKVAFHRKARDLIKGIPPEGLAASELGERFGGFLTGLRDGHSLVYSAARGKWRDPSIWLLVDIGISSDGLFISGSDIPQLKGTRGYRLRGVNGHPTEKILTKSCEDVPCENPYRAYSLCAAVVRSFKFMKNLFPDLDPEGAITYNLESPDGTNVDRTIPWEVMHEINRLPHEIAVQKMDGQRWLDKPVRWAGLERSDEMFYFRFFEKQRTAYFKVATIMGREAYETALREKVDNAEQMLRGYYQSKKQEMPTDTEQALKGVPSFVEEGEQLLREMQSKGMTRLIVDLRGNGGGYTSSVFPFFYQMYGDAYYGHRFRSEFVTRVSQLFLDKYHATLEEMRKRLNDPELELGGYHFEEEEALGAEAARKKAIAEYLDKHYSFAKALEALDGKPIYTPKKVVVLCDTGTFSAAFHMMAYLRDMGATVLGVPSSQSPNTFMETTEFKLPESGLRGSISNSTQIFTPDDPKANVFHPDCEVTYSIFKKYDFDEETSLRYALDLISEGKL